MNKMTEREALKLALEALKMIDEAMPFPVAKLAQAAIKEALEQPEQEPVAFINVEQRKLEWAKYMSWDTPTVVNLPKIPLYTAPQPAQQEPVAWMSDSRVGFRKSEFGATPTVPLCKCASAQRTWVGLTDEECKKFLGGDAYGATIHDIRAIEAKLKEKNT